MKEDRIRYLLEQYVNKASTKEELNELVEMAKEPQLKEFIEKFMDERYQSNNVLMKGDDVDWGEMYQKIVASKTGAVVYEMKRSSPWRIWRWAAAAVVLIVAGYGVWVTGSRKSEVGSQKSEVAKTRDVAPGKQGAILTLSNGQQIVLDSTKGNIASEGGVSVVNRDGSVRYQLQGAGSREEIVYNTMSTPKGRQYQLTLQDGSKVWLNAASSIRFPTAFTGKDRVVEITGEVYFEVAASPDPSGGGGKRPFIVSVNDMQVEVLGTHFNINSYNDEGSMKTTLLEGKIRVTRNGNIAVLRPGQQVVSKVSGDPSTELRVTSDVDIEEVMAWKNGIFHFSNASLQEIMRQIVRWYDVDVVYQGSIPDRRFEGEISRNSKLSEVLKILEESKVHFSIEDKKLIVKP